MTTRLYYTDSLLQTFTAVVVSCEMREGRTEIVLDQTAFYPTSGGQPFDTGTLGGANVVDVFDREDGEIVHVVEATDRTPSTDALSRGSGVTCAIDWPRRFDHMQQHSGQHLLSAAFDRLFGVRTLSFHMSEDVSTLDLDREVTPAQVAAAEAEASRIVWEDHAVIVRFAGAEDAAALPLRKASARTGELRLVDMAGFDLSACGGTHVTRTGMVGLIAVSGWERFKGGSRVSFVCGRRALASLALLRDQMLAATRLLSAAPADVAPMIARLQAEMKTAGKTIETLQTTLAGFAAAQLRSTAETIGGLRVVLSVQAGLDGGAVKRLCSEIVQAPGFVAIVAGAGHPAPVAVARSTDVTFDAAAWLKQAIAALGGRGGGRTEQAQGGISASGEDIVTFARESVNKGL